MLDSFRDAFRLPDLKRRILFTLGVLFIFRLGAHIPTPGIDADAMARLFEQGGVLGFLDIFAGGALRRFSVFALGVAPYINSSIIMQLLVVIFPTLEQFAEYYNTDSFMTMLTNLRATQSAKVTGEIPMEEVYIDTFAKAAVETLG